MRAINEDEGLTTLRLSGNSMGVQAAQAIAGALSSRPLFRRALWKDMFVGRLKSEIPPALVKREPLSYLSLSLFNAESIGLCAHWYRQRVLRSCGTSFLSLISIPQTTLSDAVMAARAHLVELDLSDNAFGPAGIEAIFQLLSNPACFSLRILKLNNTGMGPQGGEVREYLSPRFPVG